MNRSCLAILATVFVTPALAAKIDLSSTRANVANWQVSEVSRGVVVTAPATYIGKTRYGNIPGLTFRFREDGDMDNDGYWYSDIIFQLPANATRAELRISAMAVDDRAVVELNGHIVSDAGLFGPGQGYMTYIDDGPNVARPFLHGEGPQTTKVRKFLVAGTNDLRIIVNNTGDGIFGGPIRKIRGNPTNFGISALVRYDTAD